MTVLEDILSQEIIQKLGWTLLHFIWQAAVVALLLAILLKVLRKFTPSLRYIIACLALGLIVLLPVITIQLVPVSVPQMATHIEPAPAPAVLATEEIPIAETIVLEERVQAESVTPVYSISWKQRTIDALEPALPYIVSGWLVGVFGLSVWHLGGWTQLQRLKRRMVKQVDDTLHSKLKVLAQRLRIKQTVQLMESALVQIPTVVGWLRPLILLPASALTGLTSEQLEAILAHELAHIRRHDYLVNILQTVVEILGFYHPAMWWVSHKIRAERENCCDDLAVSISGDRVCYARALTSMEEIRAGRGQLVRRGGLAVAATGGNLFKRICRLLGKDKTDKTGFSWIPAATAILLILALVIPTALALTIKSESQEGQKPVEPQLIKLNSLPDGWKLDYDSGARGESSIWLSGMARNLVALKVVPTPANEYDKSWKEERLEFRIRSLKDERIGSIISWGERIQFDQFILSPDKYRLLYTRERIDPKTSCLIKMNRVEFPVDLNRRGMYTLVFSPKLEPLKTTDNKFLPTTCTGRVLNSKGDPLASAKVAAYELYFDMAGNVKLRLIGEAFTKDDGNFLFETRPSVKKSRSMGAEVVARKEGLAVGWAHWPLYDNQQVTITLQEPTKLSGRVVDENGKSVPNAEVRAVLFEKKTSQEEKTKWLPGIQPFNWLSAHTDKDGRFEFNNIPQNVSSDLLVTASGFSTIYTRKPDRIDKGYEWAEFTAGQTNIKITMPIEAKIEGKVVNKRTGEGVAGVTLRVIPHFTPVFFERYLCTTKEDGTFNIGGLRSGKYVIMRTGTSNPKVDMVVESGKTIRNVILKIPYEVRNPEPARNRTITPNENVQKSDSQVWDDILLGTPKEKESSAESSIPVPVLAKSPAPSAEDKAHVQVDCLIVEVSLDSKMDTETVIEAENLLGNKISLRDTKVDVLLRKAAGATAATKDKSAENKRVTQEQFKALTKMLTSRGYMRILMNPRVQVVDGKTAKIKSTHSSLQESSLQITPHVSADGHIILEVKAVLGSQGISESEEQTPISLRELYNRVSVSPDESLIIGGLIENHPAPADNVKNTEEQAKEVLFILTPTIINTTGYQTDVQTESTKDSRVTQSEFKKNLATGVTVELIGMCEYPSADKQWWQPDGSLLVNPPYDESDIDILSSRKPDAIPIEFAFRLSGNLGEPAWEAQVKGDDQAFVWWTGRRAKDGEFLTDIKSIGMFVKSDQRTIDLRLGFSIADRPYEWVEFKNISVKPNFKTDMRDKAKSAESAEKLRQLGLAVAMYADDHDKKLPDTLEVLKPYIAKEQDYQWILDNVEYLGKDKIYLPNQARIPVAYDKTQIDNQSGTNVVFLDGHVEFLTPQRLTELGISKSKEVIGMDPADKAVYKQLETIIVDLSELTPTTSFSDAIEVISNSVDPPLEIDVFWRDLLKNADIKPDTAINMDGLPEVPLGTGLESLLKAVAGGFTKLNYVVENGVIRIGTLRFLPHKMYHGVYDISGLVGTTADADDLIRRITETIEPDGWYKLSDTGEGTIIAYPIRQPKKFAVLQTRKIHQQIEHFLDDMRSSRDELPEPNLPLAPEVPLITNTFIDYELLEALKDIASMAGIVIIPDEKVVGLVTAELKDVPLDTALDIVLAGTPYVVKKTPYYYLVASAVEPLEIQKRVDSAKKLSNLGKALLIYANDHDDKYPDSLHHLPVYSNVEELRWVLANVNYPAYGKTIAVRPDTVIAYDKMLLAERKGTNVLFNDSHVEFVKPERLKELGISATGILIETVFLSVSEDYLKDVGLDANTANFSDGWTRHLAAKYPAGPNGQPYGLIIDDLHVRFLLRTVQAHHDSKALVAPRVLTRAGTTAEMRFTTEEYRYIKGYTEPNPPSDKPQPKIDKVEIGTRIWITPKLTDNNRNVNLDLKLEMRQLKGIIDGKYKGKYPYQKPIVDVINAKMPCTIPDGKTLLIGGLKINEQIKKEPGTGQMKKLLKEPSALQLKDLPLIGAAFSSKDKIKDHKMLLILVKPIINPQQKATKILPGQKDSEEHIRRLAEQLEKKLNRPAD